MNCVTITLIIPNHLRSSVREYFAQSRCLRSRKKFDVIFDDCVDVIFDDRGCNSDNKSIFSKGGILEQILIDVQKNGGKLCIEIDQLHNIPSRASETRKLTQETEKVSMEFFPRNMKEILFNIFDALNIFFDQLHFPTKLSCSNRNG